MIHMEGFTPFFGVVEDNNDPEELGRVRVRVYGHHTRNRGKIPIDYLPWMSTITPNSSGVSGIGHTPSDYALGSNVFGFLMGDDNQIGIVMGSVTGRPSYGPDTTKGFFDPSGTLPNYEINESDVNRLARDPSSHWLHSERSSNRVSNVPTSSGGAWSELGYDNQCLYPMNHVYESENGYVFEVDDTKGKERINEHHASGSYREISPDGSTTIKVVGDGYELVMQDKNVYVRGNVNLTVDSDCNTYIKGDWNVKVDNDINYVVGGDVTTRIDGNETQTVKGNMDYVASNINLN